MNTEARTVLEPLIDRLAADIEAGQFQVRYDPGADIFTLVVYRPDDAVTLEDSGAGAYIDFDPALRRFSALTVLGYRQAFLPAHSDPAATDWRVRLKWGTMSRLDAFLSRLGVDTHHYWDHILSSSASREALRRYERELRKNPDRLEGVGTSLLAPALP